ncbi:lysophospholipid acyltransferase family protein [Plantactinospora sp. WMMC1484]|uniref:lysophospholipid acyltransferase family protein n=1 Tax=Plantactinospora sp. WMMC1484 TaxID=3404122 RepID=UPI003BF4B98C
MSTRTAPAPTRPGPSAAPTPDRPPASSGPASSGPASSGPASSGTASHRRSLWRPQSNCGPACLPAPGEVPRVSGARQLVRLVALVGALLFGALLLPVLPVLSRAGRQAAGRRWARTVLRAGGIRLDVRGRPPLRRALLVANHVSWLDVLAILAVTPARLLAKHEVRRWPLIGPLAALGGTVFIDRTRPRTLPETVAQVAEVLRADGVVAVFPEGTTWCGLPRRAIGCGEAVPFRPALFQAAIDAAAPVVPVRLTYGLAPGESAGPVATGGEAAGAGDTTAPAFLAEESLYTSVRRALAVRGLAVTLTVVDEPWADGAVDRRRLAAAAQSAVRGTAPSAAVPSVPAVPAVAAASVPPADAVPLELAA